MKPFRAYDIRGLYGTEITPHLAYQIGASLKYAIPDRIAVARDPRPSGEPLRAALIAGILASGCDAYDLGLAPTPALYFSIVHYSLSGGVVVTASHNPPEYNGLKISGERALSLSYETGLSDIEARIASGNLPIADWSAVGNLRSLNWSRDYSEKLIQSVDVQRKLKVVVDVGNGAGGMIDDVLRALGADVECLFKDPDGRFPNHIPDPLREETLDALKRAVLRNGADMGIALDGDCDRVGFVDERGRALGGDATAMIFAKDLLSSSPGSEIIVNVLASKAVSEYVAQLGGRTRMVRVGHSYIMSELMGSEAKMAGELSGHYYFSDRYLGFDDGIYAALRMVEIASKSSASLSGLVATLPSYSSSPELRVGCADDQKSLVMGALTSEVSRLDYKVVTLDGLRLERDIGWALIRPSNTEPALVIRFEGVDQRSLDQIRAEVTSALKLAISRIGIKLDLSSLEN